MVGANVSIFRTRYVSTCFVKYLSYSAMSVSNWYTAPAAAVSCECYAAMRFPKNTVFKLLVFMLNKHNSHILMNRAGDGSKSKQSYQSNTVKAKEKKKVTRAVPM